MKFRDIKRFGGRTEKAFNILLSHLENNLPDYMKRKILISVGNRIAAVTEMFHGYSEIGNRHSETRIGESHSGKGKERVERRELARR